MFQMLQKRFFCTSLSKSKDPNWRVKQVTKSNFNESLEELKIRISDSDCIAVSLQKTGSFSSGWQRVLPFDSAQIAYCKAKRAAERFQLFQFAICPFSIRASKILAHPYNFHLFPRDESNLGMPAFGFSCQPSYLTSMANEGFDFNACINDGISYLSRSQQATFTKEDISATHGRAIKASPPHGVADMIFINRVRARIKHWMDMCESPTKTAEESLVLCLRKLILGSGVFGSRPCINIEVCSERQVQLIFQLVEVISNDLLPLIIPAKGGLTQAVQIVKTCSIEDRDIVMKEIQDSEVVPGRKNRGFGDIIELVSASQKPILTHNSLYDLTFVHSKFLAPLPPTMDEFMSSVQMAFPNILDINHIMMDMELKQCPATVSINMEIPQDESEVKNHGHNVLRIIHLFAKLCLSNNSHLDLILQNYSNNFNPCPPSSLQPTYDEVSIWARKVSSDDLVFLWGFKNGLSAAFLKEQLTSSLDILSSSEELLDVRLVDKSCAIVAFWHPRLSKRFVDIIMGGTCEKLCGGIALKAAGYETYKKAWESGVWETDLADSMDKAESNDITICDSKKPCVVYWDAHPVHAHLG